jgi:SAM-dependent methyltransferase
MIGESTAAPRAEEPSSAASAETKDAEIARKRVRAHWADWATKYGRDLRATTLASSIKRLEINALWRAIERSQPRPNARVLEVGCGNGQNIAALAGMFENYSWTGVDYIPEMISAAKENCPGAAFLVGDAMDLPDIGPYDIVYTDRMLINLANVTIQKQVIARLAALTENALILIENSRQTKDAQNDLREVMGLPRRKDAAFNVFLDDEVIIPHLKSLFATVEVEDFGSLHDILLYVLLPATLGDAGHYDHPVMQAVADLCSKAPIPAGYFGQNRLYFCKH